MKETIGQLQKQLSENQAPLQVQTIYKDSSSITEKLVKEFEAKIQQKEAEMVKEIESYEKKNSSLVLRVAELETELLSLKK